MSIIVGKRTYNERFGNDRSNDMLVNQLYKTKMVLQENLPGHRNFGFQYDNALISQSLATLKRQFPQINEKELTTVLSDCDFDLEISTEILQKSIQEKAGPTFQQPAPARNIKKIQKGEKTEQIQRINPRARRSDSMIQEEDPSPMLQQQAFQNLAENTLNSLQACNSREEIQDILAQVVLEVKNEAEKKDLEKTKKLQDHKQILIKIFKGQQQAIESLQEKELELGTLLNTHEQERGRLKGKNYGLEFKLKNINTCENPGVNFDVY